MTFTSPNYGPSQSFASRFRRLLLAEINVLYAFLLIVGFVFLVNPLSPREIAVAVRLRVWKGNEAVYHLGSGHLLPQIQSSDDNTKFSANLDEDQILEGMRWWTKRREANGEMNEGPLKQLLSPEMFSLRKRTTIPLGEGSSVSTGESLMIKRGKERLSKQSS